MTRATKRQRLEDNETAKEEVNSLPATGGEKEESMVGKMQLKRATTDKRMTNRQKCLVLGSRNISGKNRHLLNDIRGLMPHAREHSKIAQTQKLGDDLVELCSLHQCNSSLLIEAHRHDISYMWITQAPHGPSVKLQLTNVHTADELRMAGNCLKYSRPLIHFDREFETQPHLAGGKVATSDDV
ncbi:ribosome biogenesis protein [Trypanosoma rangeli]|uniref:Ribosome biogenesis protein n=1 Tax=Trypanosoma rangeli TaxID=5698 RepID=A0A3R7KF62_TRYRA|nr:ribosome biogenesis protein [Trypanosoma rangeli]RNE99273.1 ribosome biogenesis protein [Trypanosoma rangeli]|eukprot:RNE99273.1 ribosome biogenesis protein [Trypanosoma rangeli]